MPIVSESHNVLIPRFAFRLLSVVTCIASVGVATIACQSRPEPEPARTEVSARATKAEDSENLGEIEKIALGIGDIFRFNYASRNSNRPKPAVRAAFRRTLGCAYGDFNIEPDVGQKLGLEKIPDLFTTPTSSERRTFRSIIRFSRDRTAPTDEDDWDEATIAVAIKLFEGNQPESLSSGFQDFIFQNHPVFFVTTARQFLASFASPRAMHPDTFALVKPILDNTVLTEADRDRTSRILEAMNKPVGNVLRKTYWSVTPYRFGPTHAKYRFLPVHCGSEKSPDPATRDEPLPEPKSDKNLEYLKERLFRDLAASPACFDFQVQRYIDEARTPIDDATQTWENSDTPPITVARLRIHKQPIGDLDGKCEQIRYSPWHASKDLLPAGSINEARKFIYDRFSDCRAKQNQGADPDALSHCFP